MSKKLTILSFLLPSFSRWLRPGPISLPLPHKVSSTCPSLLQSVRYKARRCKIREVEESGRPTEAVSRGKKEGNGCFF